MQRGRIRRLSLAVGFSLLGCDWGMGGRWKIYVNYAKYCNNSWWYVSFRVLCCCLMFCKRNVMLSFFLCYVIICYNTTLLIGRRWIFIFCALLLQVGDRKRERSWIFWHHSEYIIINYNVLFVYLEWVRPHHPAVAIIAVNGERSW